MLEQMALSVFHNPSADVPAVDGRPAYSSTNLNPTTVELIRNAAGA
ncbi:hypothetical protein [Actinoplanes sp. NPDC089786]